MYHVLTYSQEIDTRQTCSDVLETMKDPAPIVNADASDAAGVLPLALTLVFLCVGIVALTILYLVFKGCLRDRSSHFIKFYHFNFHVKTTSVNVDGRSSVTDLYHFGTTFFSK